MTKEEKLKKRQERKKLQEKLKKLDSELGYASLKPSIMKWRHLNKEKYNKYQNRWFHDKKANDPEWWKIQCDVRSSKVGYNRNSKKLAELESKIKQLDNSNEVFETKILIQKIKEKIKKYYDKHKLALKNKEIFYEMRRKQNDN